MKKSGNPARLLFRRCALLALVAGLTFVGIHLFRFYRDQASRPPAEFPRVGSSTKVLLKIEYPKHQTVDVSGQDPIIHAIGSLKHQHIVGRSIGPTRVQGVLEVDGAGFKFDACMIETGYRATVENETDAWESVELGEVLYKWYGGK